MAVTRKNLRFSACPMMQGGHIACPTPLLQQFLHQTQRDSKPLRDFLASPPGLIVTLYDPFPHFHCDRFHAAALPAPGTNGYIIN